MDRKAKSLLETMPKSTLNIEHHISTGRFAAAAPLFPLQPHCFQLMHFHSCDVPILLIKTWVAISASSFEDS